MTRNSGQDAEENLVLLFSYGTLRDSALQRKLFGRPLKGYGDTLQNYQIQDVHIQDKDVIAKSGTDIHPGLVCTNNSRDSVKGMVFELTFEELLKADQYEVADYQRIKLSLVSKKRAWVYVLRSSV